MDKLAPALEDRHNADVSCTDSRMALDKCDHGVLRHKVCEMEKESYDNVHDMKESYNIQ